MELFPYEKEHLSRLRASSAECMVLLKTNGAFPLDMPSTLAAYGSGVRCSVKGGTGSGEVNSRFSVTIEQGLKEAGFTLRSGVWLDAYDDVRAKARESFRKALREEARAAGANLFAYGMGAVMPEPEFDLPVLRCADAAIYVVSRISGEGNDRRPISGDVLLTNAEIRDILRLNSLYERFMLVLNVGGPVDLTPVTEVGNILLLSQLGTEMGSALADVLLGKLNPSGKLSTTWAAWEDYCPDIDMGDRQETYYTEGVYVGYRYFSTVGKKPLFPFGFGLSYTRFSVGEIEAKLDGENVSVTAEIKNTGDRSGKEVLQVYVRAPEGVLKKPSRELAGFAKTRELKPGESERLEVGFRLSELACFDPARSAYLLEAGEYVLYAGTDSASAAPVSVLTLGEDIVLKTVRAIASPALFAECGYERREEQSTEDLPHIPVDGAAFRTEEVDYDLSYEVEPEIEKLSDGELSSLCVGSFPDIPSLNSVVGSAASHVAGAAGETSSRVEKKGIGVLVMADGPAGLRLSKDYYLDKKGAHPLGGSTIPGSILELMSGPLKKIAALASGGTKAPKGAELRHQYCTALPIGTAIAQSWNTEFARECGDIVGEEMERFGVQLWLAPALNIHRSILCGRNFEYFSEDPLLSGRMAAALTKGVQAHRGCGVTIKHFAANNQEFNRYYNNSNVSERALREIYLRGFGICVREAKPHALMTSYNLINGTHSAEMRGLIEDYLRAENGFEGIVMTDWITQMPKLGSSYPKTRSDKVMAAGGDLFMPGCRADCRQILDALRDGSLPRRQLEINASRVLRMIRKLRG